MLTRFISITALSFSLLVPASAGASVTTIPGATHHAISSHPRVGSRDTTHRAVRARRVRHGRPPIIPWATWLKVLNVHHCEEPVWNVRGPQYFGGLGWRDATWQAFRASWMPVNMADATPLQQAWAMAHFIAQDNGGYWPDQPAGHCTGGY